MSLQTVDLIAAGLFAVALVHTFAAKQLERLSHRFPRHAGLFHLLGEVEVVFGFWAIVLVLAMALASGGKEALAYAESCNYTEPLFVFVVMVIAGSRPVLESVRWLVNGAARMLPLPGPLAITWLGLALVPLMGSLVTEPAAMTLAALMLAPLVFRPELPEPPKYVAIGVLFVTRFTMLYDDWRGYVIAGFSLVWVANVYMSLFGRLRLDIRHERVNIEAKEAEVENQTK